MRSPETLRSFVTFLNGENVQARTSAEPFLTLPPAQWPTNAHLGFGALDLLLDEAHRQLDGDVTRALALTALVLDRATEAHVPEGFAFLRSQLVGRAWKDHANALSQMGEADRALEAAETAVWSFSSDDSLAVDRAAALLALGWMNHERGRDDTARAFLQDSKQIFQEHGENRRLLQISIMEASMLYDAGHYASARAAYLAALRTAEELGEHREQARVLNNLGQCEVQLKNRAAAMKYLDRALIAFDREEMTSERQFALWGRARVARDSGRLEDSVAQLLNVRNAQMANGKIVSAAEAGLDVVEILAATGDRDRVVAIAQELMRVFSNAGMERNLRKAFAYLAEQASIAATSDDDLSALQSPLRHVRAFVRRLDHDPAAAFHSPAA